MIAIIDTTVNILYFVYMVRRFFMMIIFLFISAASFAQMDMLPQLLRDLPPELQEGIPEEMTYKEYRQLNRNVDFFTMFMSMFVPGYGFFQVEKPGLGSAVVAGRTAGYALMTTGLVRQWNSLQDLGNAAELSVDDFNQLVTNAALFGSGILVNGLGWALDVIGAYHIAKKEKDFVIYKYGLRKEIGGGGELNLISYIRKLQLQPEDKQAAEDLEYSLLRFVTLYPFSEYAAEAEFYLSLFYRREKQPADALLHAGRLVFLYPDNRFTAAAKRLGIDIVQSNAARWREDVPILMRMTHIQQRSGSNEENYYRFIKALAGLQHRDFRSLFPAETNRFLTLFPESEQAAEILFLRGSHFAEEQDWEETVIEYIKCAALYPDSPHAPRALLAGAKILENQLGRPEYAAGYYREITERYPETEEARQAAGKR
jgi:TolA-binding protein